MLGAGGIGNRGALTLTNSTIAHNRGIFGGGGIMNGGTGTATITNSTIADNISDFGSGGGLWHEGGMVVLQNTILARNRAPLRVPIVWVRSRLGAIT